MLCASLTLAAIIPCAQAEPAAAPGRAFFRAGEALEVSGTRVSNGWTYLQLPGGGEIAVPSDQLLRIEPLPASHAPRVEKPALDALPIAEAESAPASGGPSAAPPGPAAGTHADAPRFEALIHEASRRYSLDPQLVKAMIRVESNFEPRAVSRAGAQGLLQLMPETSRLLGVVDPFDPQQNIDAGARHFRSLLDRFSGDVVLALAAYNAGEHAVKRHGGLPPFNETRKYVDRVITFFGLDF